jgi:hypothetical protein
MVARGLLGHEQEFLDSRHVMEEGMRHFYGEADEPARRGDRIAGCDVASWQILLQKSAVFVAGSSLRPL